MNFQGLETIVNLMKDERDTTKAYACTCLTNMAGDEVIREEISQYSFGQSILPALNSTNAMTESKACLAIAAFSVDANIRYEVT